ncbi:MAG: hypothetical protein ACD_30C00010G0001, partial [uncultured bacterium]
MAVTKNIIKQPKAQVQVQVTMPWADVEPKWNETLQKMSAEVELAGFRKGTAPLNMVEQQLSTRLSDEVVKVIMPQALIEALQGTNIVPIDYPKYQSIQFQKGTDLVFTALLTERPAVTVGEYKTIKVARPAQKTITDEEVAKVIDDIFKRWKLRQPQTPTPAQSTPVPAAPQSGGSLSFNAPADTTQP